MAKAAPVAKAALVAPVAAKALTVRASVKKGLTSSEGLDGDEEKLEQKYKGDVPYKREEPQIFTAGSRFAYQLLTLTLTLP